MIVWLCYRQPYSNKDTIVACVELVLAHLLAAGGNLEGCLCQIIITALLQSLKNKKMFLAIFLGLYLSVNFWVNTIDGLFNGLLMEKYGIDELF